LKNKFPYTAGLDVGYYPDYSALALIEKAVVQPPLDAPPGTRPRLEYRLIDLYRFPEERTPYNEVREYLKAYFSEPPLRGATRLVIEANGIGNDSYQVLNQKGYRNLIGDVRGLFAHGGQHTNYENGIWKVPRRDLVHGFRVGHEDRAIKIAHDLPFLDIFLEELAAYQMKVNQLTGHDSYANNPRLTDHDDLVDAACAAFWGGRKRFGSREVRFY
jgi:hypothetical protein